MQLLLALLVKSDRPSPVKLHIALYLLFLAADAAATACAYDGDLTEHLVHTTTLSVGILGHSYCCRHLAATAEAAIEIGGVVV